MSSAPSRRTPGAGRPGSCDPRWPTGDARSHRRRRTGPPARPRRGSPRARGSRRRAARRWLAHARQPGARFRRRPAPRRRRCRRPRSRRTPRPRFRDRGRCRRRPQGDRGPPWPARPRRPPRRAGERRWQGRPAPRRFEGSPRAGRVASLPQRSLRSLRHGLGDRPSQLLAHERGGVLPHPAACPAQPEEVLDVTARTGQRARRDAEDAQAQPVAASATPCTADRRSAGSRTTPSPTAARPTSN